MQIDSCRAPHSRQGYPTGLYWDTLDPYHQTNVMQNLKNERATTLRMRKIYCAMAKW